MAKNKKIIIGLISIITIIAILFGIYKVCTSYLFEDKNSIPDGKVQLIDKLKGIENSEERKKQIDFSVEHNIITQEEANELY